MILLFSKGIQKNNEILKKSGGDFIFNIWYVLNLVNARLSINPIWKGEKEICMKGRFKGRNNQNYRSIRL